MPHSITLNAQVLTPKGYRSASNLELNQEIIVYNPKTKETAPDYIQSIFHSIETYPKLFNNFQQQPGKMTFLWDDENICLPAEEEKDYYFYQTDDEKNRTIDESSYRLGKITAYMINNLLYQNEDGDKKILAYADYEHMIDIVYDSDLTKINEVIFKNRSKVVNLYSFYFGYIEHYENIKLPLYTCYLGDYLYKKYKKGIEKLKDKRKLFKRDPIVTCVMYSFKTSNHPDWGIIVDGFIVQQ